MSDTPTEPPLAAQVKDGYDTLRLLSEDGKVKLYANAAETLQKCVNFNAALDAISEEAEPLSNCCGSPFLAESDFCSSCKEHAVAELCDLYLGLGVTATVQFDPLLRTIIDIDVTETV